jgi:hypothetical protein
MLHLQKVNSTHQDYNIIQTLITTHKLKLQYFSNIVQTSKVQIAENILSNSGANEKAELFGGYVINTLPKLVDFA